MDREITIADLICAFVVGVIFSGVSISILWSFYCSEREKRVEAETRAETLEQLRDARHIALPFKTLEELEAFLETEAARLFPPEKTK